MMNKKAIRIVLVNTSHPGNIGGAARAMKNMGLTTLHLVEPEIFPHVKATARASGADDILSNAHIHSNLPEALVGCRLVIGTSARLRALPSTMLSARECGRKAVEESQLGDVAIVFGRENSGLTNEELAECHYHVKIPTNPDFSALNIACAVQIIAYEIWMSAQAKGEVATEAYDELAPYEEVERVYTHFTEVLAEVGLISEEMPRAQLLARLKRLLVRTRLEVIEAKVLRGILKAIQVSKQNG